MLLTMWMPMKGGAQVMKNERLLSFEEVKIPAFITETNSKLSISNEHYKDGHQSLSWQFRPGAVLTIKKDLKFEKKDPTGKDTYLSCFYRVGIQRAGTRQENRIRILERRQEMYLFSFWN